MSGMRSKQGTGKTRRMTSDPPIRADGRCAQCRGLRLIRLPKVITQRSKTELLEHLAADAFCSATCARAWHRVDVKRTTTKSPERRPRMGDRRMTTVLGIDVSSHAIDLVLLDEETNAGSWHHLKLQGKTSFDRLRKVPLVMPKWSFYEDMGVYLIAIEGPKTRFMPSAAALFPVYGAVISCLPRRLQVWDVHPTAWRQGLGLPGNAKKDACAARAVELGAQPEWAVQDAYDAYSVALYARDTNQRGIQAA